MATSNCALTKDINNKSGIKENSKSWKPLLRQIFVWSGVIIVDIMSGMSCAIPNVMIVQIRREANSTNAISENMASWITSVYGYAAIPWIILMPMLAKKFGRKIPFVFIGITSLIAYIILYISANNTLRLISQVMQGILVGSNFTLLVVVVTEYTTPQYRGILLTLKTSSFYWGLLIADTIGTFTHWKCITYVGFTFSLYCFTALYWPESPSWLAMKGRYDDCAKAHHWLKGYDCNSEKDLESLIHSQIESIKTNSQRKRSFWLDVKYLIRTFRSKEFYKPLLIGSNILTLFVCTGKLTCTMYSITVIKKITKSESMAYIGMLILDAIAIFAIKVASILSKYVNRRTLLLTSSTIGVIIHFIIAFYLYLIKLLIITENHIFTLSLLTLFLTTICFGPSILASGLCGELTPLRFRNISLPILAIYYETLMGTLLKIFPFMISIIGLHGIFLFYGLSTSFLALMIFKYLPETKDKTLQEIEDFFKETSANVTVSPYASPLLNPGMSEHMPVSSVFSSSLDPCVPVNIPIIPLNKSPYKSS